MISNTPMPLKKRIVMVITGLVILAFMGTPIVKMLTKLKKILILK